jgi:hypothetical protein
MLLQEILNSKIKYTVVKETANTFVTQAEIGGRLIRFTADEMYERWNVEFAEVTTRHKHNWGRTGSGSELQVFSMVVDSMKEFMSRYHPTVICFSASKDDGSDARVSLYRRLASKYLKGWTREEFDHGDSTEFTYTKDE